MRKAYDRRRGSGDTRSHLQIAEESRDANLGTMQFDVKTARSYAEGRLKHLPNQRTLLCWLDALRGVDKSIVDHAREERELIEALGRARAERKDQKAGRDSDPATEPAATWRLQERSGRAHAKPPSHDSGPPTERADIHSFAMFAPSELIGREEQVRLLDTAWQRVVNNEPGRPQVLVFHALGGEGKTGLVARWAVDLATQGRAGSRPIVAWSFYNQGTGQGTAAHSNAFLIAALRQLGDEATAAAPTDDRTKAERLTELLRSTGALLVLDGVEPLQYAPGPSMQAGLKDDALKDLLVGLAIRHSGLCVVTTRYPISDLDHSAKTTAPQIKLPALSPLASVQLLRVMRQGEGEAQRRLFGTDVEFSELAEWSGGHALTLILVGGLLLLAHEGELQMRDQVTLHAADEAEELAKKPTRRGHAWRVMDAYVRWFEEEGIAGRRALVVLHLLGLFDRPAPIGCITAVLGCEGLDGFTAPMLGAGPSMLNIVCNRLHSIGLVRCLRDNAPGKPLVAIDAHPLVREYFADKLRRRETVWAAAHGSLFEYLRSSVRPRSIKDITSLDPLYQAIGHGCQAGLHQAAFDDVFVKLIARGNQNMSTSRFGAVNNDIAALSCFFAQPWKVISHSLRPDSRAKIASLAAFRLRSASRFKEARPLMKKALRYYASISSWSSAANEAGNFSVLCMHEGKLTESEELGRKAVEFARRNAAEVRKRERQDARVRSRRGRPVMSKDEADAQTLIANRLATLGDPLVQMGPPRRAEALRVFKAAEAIQARVHRDRELLHSTKGYRYLELLLDMGKVKEVLERAQRVEAWTVGDYQLLDQGQLALVRARACLLSSRKTKAPADLQQARAWIGKALNVLRKANFQESVVYSLLIQAELDREEGHFDKVVDALNIAWGLASRGPLRLFQTDILLARVRVYCRMTATDPQAAYAWDSPHEDLALATDWIAACGYLRRRAEAVRLQRLLEKTLRAAQRVRP
jgi:tetratricopeptide (TPR) repeat protein